MLTKILKKIIGIFGYKILNKNYFKNNRLVYSRSYLNIELFLKKLFFKNKIKFIIQIGANDGIIFDHLNKFIKKYKPVSILVEPIKTNFEQLKKNYKYFNNVKFENSAISINGEISFLYKVKNSKISLYDKHIPGITSFNKNHLINHGVKNSHIIKETVHTISIKKLLSKYSITRVDLIFIDTEGYDCKIVYDFFTNSFLRPIIIFEYIHCDNSFLIKLIGKLTYVNYIFFPINENLVCCPAEKKRFLDLA